MESKRLILLLNYADVVALVVKSRSI